MTYAILTLFFITYVMDSKTKVPLGTTAQTGQICPESGKWVVVGTPTTSAPIAKGNRMPPYRDKAVTWKLTEYI
jgi:hypothetical protein